MFTTPNESHTKKLTDFTLLTTQIKMAEQMLRNAELRLNDLVRLEESMYQLNVMMFTTAARIDFHVRTLLTWLSCPRLKQL